MTHLEFTAHCRQGRCLRGNAPNKRCALDSRRLDCYEKYLKRKQKEKQTATAVDSRWEKVRKAVFDRDGHSCRLWRVLTSKEQCFVLTQFGRQFRMLQELDPAHVQGRNAAPEHKYDPDMVFTLCRYFHSLMDTYRDPVTQEPMTKEQRDQWWQRIRTGRKITNPYSGIPRKHEETDIGDYS